ncbi:MAG: hypothetical protein KAX18_14000 [Candidatus Lokiarchaeota archaeon]|nr:hypothetical protein [Candidatus Lokiarchaeota archaeon]
MAHVSKKKSVRMNCIDVEQINLEMRLEQIKAPEIIECKQVEKKPAKKQLSKLIKKAELNAKYPEQVIPIQRVERQRVYRDYGLR